MISEVLLRGVGLVVHEKKVEVAGVVDEESLVAGRHHVAGLPVAAVTDLDAGPYRQQMSNPSHAHPFRRRVLLLPLLLTLSFPLAKSVYNPPGGSGSNAPWA